MLALRKRLLYKNNYFFFFLVAFFVVFFAAFLVAFFAAFFLAMVAPSRSEHISTLTVVVVVTFQSPLIKLLTK